MAKEESKNFSKCNPETENVAEEGRAADPIFTLHAYDPIASGALIYYIEQMKYAKTPQCEVDKVCNVLDEFTTFAEVNKTSMRMPGRKPGEHLCKPQKGTVY